MVIDLVALVVVAVAAESGGPKRKTWLRERPVGEKKNKRVGLL